MKNRLPRFEERGRDIYYADSCRSLMEAANRGELELHAIGRYGYPGERIPQGSLPGLSSAGYWDAKHAQKWGLPPHRNEGIEFTFMDTGETAIRVEGTRMQFHADEVLITRPWQEHEIGGPNVSPGRLVWLILDVGVRRPHQPWRWPSWIILEPDDIAELERYLRQNEQHVWKATADVRRCFLGLADALKRGGPPLSSLAVWTNALLLQVLELFRSQQVRLTESLTGAERSVKQFLREVLGSLEKPWTQQTMAESCQLGVTRFIHYVRRITNVPPAEYLLNARLEKARTLLSAEPAKSIAEVAKQCGFSSGQYLGTLFKRQFGTTPDAYRREQGVGPAHMYRIGH